MMNVLTRWFRSPFRSRRQRRRHPVNLHKVRARLAVESLEDRITPAATIPSPATAPPPFVSVAFGASGQVLEVVTPDGMLTQYDSAGAHAMGGGVRSASAARAQRVGAARDFPERDADPVRRHRQSCAGERRSLRQSRLRPL